MRILIISLFIAILIADDIEFNNLSVNSDSFENFNDDLTNKISNVELPKNKVKEAVLSIESINVDEKLKNDIVSFDRVSYGDTMNNIKDPFIYVNQQSKETLENIDKIQNAKLVLYAVFDKKAKVNNSWVGKNDNVDGWTVTDIKNDRVELKFNAQTKVLYVYSKNNKFDIK